MRCETGLSGSKADGLFIEAHTSSREAEWKKRPGKWFW